jgi:TonB-linked SusC/RagA family outer membrane protein
MIQRLFYWLCILISWWLFSNTLSAQVDIRLKGDLKSGGVAGRKISGIVTDMNNESLISATVKIINRSNGQVIAYTGTDDNGKFRISVPENTNSAGLYLVVSYVGYKSYEALVDGIAVDEEIKIELAEDFLKLEEIVVVGYGTQQKKDFAGSAASIGGSDFANTAISNVDQALQGRMTGVQVTQNSGTPGAGISVRVRGASSISAGNQPLYVIDGVPLNVGDNSFDPDVFGGQKISSISDLNPNDIESIDVLKDASAAAIYGSRAANGVVMITTKRGKQGKTTFNLNGYTGFSRAWRKLKLLNSKQYVELLREAARNDSLDPEVEFPGLRDSINTDWQDQVFRTGSVQNLELSASGGDEKTKFFVSGGYFREKGIVLATGYTRFNSRLNLDHNVNDKLSLGVSLGLTRSLMNRISSDNSIYSPFANALANPPNEPVFNPDGSYYQTTYANPVGIAKTNENTNQTYRVIGNLYVNYEILPGLSLRTNWGVDGQNNEEKQFFATNIGVAVGTSGQINTANTTVIKYLNENTITYKRLFNDKHLFIGLGGVSFEINRKNGLFVQGITIPNNNFRFVNAAAITPAGSSFLENWGLLSYFSRFNYTYDDKYLFSFNLRADGSSRFGKDNRFGFFPSFSAAWRISKESFMQSLTGINDLKLRLSYGVTGNQELIGNFAARGLWRAGFNYFNQAGIVPVQLANPDLKWETTRQLNIGADLVILRERLSVVVDYYEKKTVDLLLDRPLPSSTGYTFRTENIGSIENKGIELGINTQILAPKDGSLSWNSALNWSTNRNRVLKLYNDQPLNVGFVNRIQVGQPLGAFYGWESQGVNQATGDIIFADLNGDQQITAADRKIIGSPWPKWFGGWTNTFSYKGFELIVFLQYSVGNKIYSGLLTYAMALGNDFTIDNQLIDALDRWRPDNPSRTIPRATLLDPNNNNRASTRFVQDGSYMRVKNLVLSYSLPQPVIKRLGFSAIKLYVQGQNLLTFTKYNGFDPEVNFEGPSSVVLGTDFYTYPMPRSITFGFNLGF